MGSDFTYLIIEERTKRRGSSKKHSPGKGASAVENGIPGMERQFFFFENGIPGIERHFLFENRITSERRACVHHASWQNVGTMVHKSDRVHTHSHHGHVHRHAC